MTVRRFDGTGFITLAIGGLVGANTGAFTTAALVRKDVDGAFLPVISAETGASGRRGLWTHSSDAISGLFSGSLVQGPTTLTVADDWAVIAVTKEAGPPPDGITAIRVHKGVLGGAWTHADGGDGSNDGQVVDNVKIGSFQGSTQWIGLIGVVAWWKRALSDVELENGLRDSLQAWSDIAPDGLWALDQIDLDPVIDLTGNGADQIAVVGTTVADAPEDQPPGFDFGGSEEHAGDGQASSVMISTEPGVGVAGIINALVNPESFGYPGETNTGVPPGTVLTPFTGSIVVTEPGTIIEELDIDYTGEGVGVFLTATAHNCVVRRCRIRGTPASGGGAVKADDNALDWRVEDCEMDYFEAGSYDSVIGSGNWTALRNSIHRVSEGPRLGQNCHMEFNYIRRLKVDDPGAHADGAQSTGGSNIVIRRNTIVASEAPDSLDFANSALIVGTEGAASTGVIIELNLLDGGGFTFFLGVGNFPMTDVLVRNNRFGRGLGPQHFGPFSSDNLLEITGLAWANNVFDDQLNWSAPIPTGFPVFGGDGETSRVNVIAEPGTGFTGVTVTPRERTVRVPRERRIVSVV